jgi:DNA-binding transcriptional LysR family regulator
VALTVLAAYDELVSTSRSQQPRQKLRLGFPDDYALAILPRVLDGLRRQGLDLELDVHCDLSANLSTALQRGEVDLALVTLEARPAAAVLGVDVDLDWVSGVDFALGPGRAVPLAAYPEGCVFRRAMISTLDRAGRTWHVAAQSRSHSGIMAAVWGGLAVTAVARGTAPLGLRDCRAGLGLPQLPRVPLFLLGGKSGAASTFTEALAEVMRGMGEPATVAGH